MSEEERLLSVISTSGRFTLDKSRERYAMKEEKDDYVTGAVDDSCSAEHSTTIGKMMDFMKAFFSNINKASRDSISVVAAIWILVGGAFGGLILLFMEYPDSFIPIVAFSVITRLTYAGIKGE